MQTAHKKRSVTYQKKKFTVVLHCPGRLCTWPRPSESRKYTRSTRRNRQRNL